MRSGEKSTLQRLLPYILLNAFALLVIMNIPASADIPGTITDSRITRAVEDQLAVDNAVSAHLIDVETNNGVVILSGSVDNILARDRALEIARTVKGVRSIIDKLDVRPVERSNDAIENDVEKALMNDPAADSHDISASVSNGIVTLEGEVQSWPEKQLAAEVAKGVRGVKGVVNDISIEYRDVRSDHEIKADVIRRLESDLYVDDRHIDVKVTGGTVTLSGTVGSLDEKIRAAADAWVNGTVKVNDGELSVDWKESDAMRRKREFVLKSDKEMEDDIKTAFYYDPRLFNFDIDVDVTNGTAALSGEVDNLRSKNVAEEDALNTIGVWRVENHLKIRPTVMPDDKQLALKIEEALERDPYLDRYDIQFVIRNYKVYLYGSVNDYFEKIRAEEIVSRLPGVVIIDNRLDVNGDKWEWKYDREILEDIESELFWNVFIDSDSINVEVENGIATISGTVDTWQESRAAMKNALEGGAKAVVNHLKIKGMPEM